MRILHIIPSLAKGGAERITIDICNALAGMGHKVLLLRMQELNTYAHIPLNFETRVINSKVIPSIRGKATIELEQWRHEVETFKPDVIHSHLFLAEVLSRQELIKGVKYFTHLHDNMPQFKNLSAGTFASKVGLTNYYEKIKLVKKYQECNNQFIAISNDAYRYFRSTLPKQLGKNIQVLQNAINYSNFYNPVREIKTNKEKFQMVSVGSLVTKKNQQFLVDIIPYLLKTINNPHIHILGDGPERVNIKEKIDKAQLNDYITLHGNVDNVQDFLNASDVYLHAATYEPFGLVLLEAMAAGLPCICLDGKGNRDVIVQGSNGYIMPANDPKEFALQVIELYENAKKRQHMATFATEFAARFDIGIYAKELLDLYK